MRAPTLPIAAALALLFAGGGCEFEEPLPDGDYALDGGGDQGGEAPADECTLDEHCPGSQPYCATPAGGRSRRCGECRASVHCSTEEPVCDGELRCVAGEQGVCRTADDCGFETPLCALFSNGEVGLCVGCLGDEDCPRDEPQCSSAGWCIGAAAFPGCIEDAECRAGRVCNGNGECVER